MMSYCTNADHPALVMVPPLDTDCGRTTYQSNSISHWLMCNLTFREVDNVRWLLFLPEPLSRSSSFVRKKRVRTSITSWIVRYEWTERKGEPCLKNLPMAMLSNSSNHLDAPAIFGGETRSTRNPGWSSLVSSDHQNPIPAILLLIPNRWFSCEPRDPRDTQESPQPHQPQMLHLL